MQIRLFFGMRTSSSRFSLGFSLGVSQRFSSGSSQRLFRRALLACGGPKRALRMPKEPRGKKRKEKRRRGALRQKSPTHAKRAPRKEKKRKKTPQKSPTHAKRALRTSRSRRGRRRGGGGGGDRGGRRDGFFLGFFLFLRLVLLLVHLLLFRV